jgi:hypothetical protein
MARQPKGYLIAGLIALALIAVLHVVCLSCCVWARGWSFPLALVVLLATTLIGPLGFLAAYWHSVRARSGRYFEATALAFGVVGVMWTAGVAFVLGHMWSFGVVVTNPARYEALRGRVQPSAHFPERIPPHARTVRFSYYPGPLQAAAHLQLRMQLPPEEIDAIVERMRRQKVMTYRGGAEPPDGRPSPDFFTSGSVQGAASPDPTAFPPSYLILQFGEPRRWEPGAWNHGSIAGIAVDRDACEVVYWAQAW